VTGRLRGAWFGALGVAALAVAAGFLALPLLAIFVDVGPGELLASLDDPVARDALALSLRTSLVGLALIVGVGTPAAYLLARREFPGRAALVTLLELPLVLPPAVAGVGLLAALGPGGLLGPALARAGIELALTQAAVVLALTFVASPFYLRQAQAAFAAVDGALLDASRTLGASEARTFARVAVPVALPGLGAGAALAWGRALGEFGATIMFAGSFQGITQTLPLAIYASFNSDFTAALAMSALLVGVSGALLLAVKLVGRRGREERAEGGAPPPPDRAGVLASPAAP
jgi:molybdate transport system permease protein